MQKYFLDEQSHAFIPSASAIINNILELINLFNKHNRPVIFTKHINNKDNAGMMNQRWREILTQDNPYSELINELIHQKATIIEKTQYDSFYNTQLENILAQCSIKELVITGVMTQLCCETTLRSAFVRGYYPIFLLTQQQLTMKNSTFQHSEIF
ncbi:MAG: cysteine hydrolase [Desulfobacterales bacterium]|nr:cysteine hydrolase [Desulfobacterales bacterium]